MREIQAPALPEGYVDCTYQREQRALVGTWRARVLLPPGSPPSMGQGWTIPGIMEGGILTSADREGTAEDGRVCWSLGGYDGGFRLMKSPPLPHEIRGRSLGAVVAEIAGACGVQADVTLAGEVGLDARNFASGQTAGNAILELAAIGGCVAYFLPDGTLRVSPPKVLEGPPLVGDDLAPPTFQTLDLDGYASGVAVILGRRGRAEKPTKPPGWWTTEPGEEEGEEGETPDGTLRVETASGSNQILGGVLTWGYAMLQPVGALQSYTMTLFLPAMGISKTIAASYVHDVRTSVVVTGNQEQRVWRWAMTGASSVESSVQDVSYYDSQSGAAATERVEWEVRQELSRTYAGDLERIVSEVVDTSVRATGQAAPSDAPPGSSRVERRWIWNDEQGYRGLVETEALWEDRDVGAADTVQASDGTPCTFTLGGGERYLLLPGHQTTTRIKRVRTRAVDEIYDTERDRCVCRVERETDDNGVADMLARGLFGSLKDKGNEDAKKAAMAWLKSLPQQGSLRVSQMPGSSSLSEEVSTLTQPGRRLKPSSEGGGGVGGWGWAGGRYVEGAYGGESCPFLLDDGSCGVLSDPASASVFEGVTGAAADGWTGGGVQTPGGSVPAGSSTASSSRSGRSKARPCTKLQGGATPGYEKCGRYYPFRYLAGQEAGAPAVPVVGTAGGGGVWLEKELFVNEDLTDEEARLAAQRIAGNLLAVRSVSRGIVEEMEVPLNDRVHPDGGILAVEHDYGSLRTRITYRTTERGRDDDKKDDLEYLMLLSTSATAANVFAREAVGRGRSAMGQVVEVRPDRALAVVGGRPVSCSSRVRVKRGDNALVFLPPGSVSNGIIQAVMR